MSDTLRLTQYTSRLTPYVSRLMSHRFLLLVLFSFTVLTLYQSFLLPLGEADDETDHYQYIRFVARTGHPPLNGAERNEAGFKGGLAPLYYGLTAWPVALVGEETLPDIRRVDSRPERHIPGDGLGINHVLHTLDEQWPFELSLRTKFWRGQILAWHLVRLLCLPMGWVTIIATYALTRRLWPEPKIIAAGAATFVAFLPRFVISSAVINDDNLVFALTSLLLLTQVIILQKTLRRRLVSARIFAIFGALFGLALLTKYFSLILVPEVIFTLIVFWVASNRRQNDRGPGIGDPQFTPHVSRLMPLLAFLTALILTASPWFIFISFRFNRIAELGLIPGLAASLGEPQITEGLVGLLSGHSVRPVAATYSLLDWFSLLYRSFWFEFGWMQLFAPGWVYGLFTVFLFLAVIGHVLHLTSSVFHFTPQTSEQSLPVSRPTFSPSPIFWLLGLHLALFLIVVLARYILSATIDTGQGRHLYPALPVIALIVSVGLSYLGQWLVPYLPSTPYSLLPTPYSLLPATCYLLPAAYCLLSPSLILTHYQTLPVTLTPPDNLPITYRHTLPFADGLFFAGFDVAQANMAGEAMPVTLYWRAEQEAQQDYLISLCLLDQVDRPAGCWTGHFADGRYPPRAWETGDTLRDTVFIPIPTCYRIMAQTYRLHLEVWPLQPGSPEPTPADSPTLQQTFTEPGLTIFATDSLTPRPQTVDVWRGNQRLTTATQVELNESLNRIDYSNHNQNPAPAFIRPARGDSDVWPPLSKFSTPLFLPCDDGPSPFAYLSSFIAAPNLPSGPYLPDDPAISSQLTLSFDLRRRGFAPISSTLTFAGFLAPLSLELPDQPPFSFEEEWENGKIVGIANLPTFQPSNFPTLHPSSLLPLTVRWQARRWMANPLIISLKLLDKDFQVGGERLATLGDRYPNVLWTPTEIIEETYPIRLQAGAPPGLYRLEMSILHQDKNLLAGYEYLPLIDGEKSWGHNLYLAVFRLLDPADGTPPPQSFSAQLGDSIHLSGYDLKPLSSSPYPPPSISLALYWRSTAKIPADYTVFTQLLGPDGQVWAQWDNPPQAGRYPTTAWTAQDSVVDRYTLTLREGAPPGNYRLLVGMYDPATSQRLPATINGQPQPDNAIEITQLTIDN